MKITDLLMSEGIELNGQVASKAEAIDKMVDLMVATGKIKDREAYRAQVLKREEEGTTGTGERNCNSPRKMRCSESTRTGSHGGTGRLWTTIPWMGNR